MNTVNLIKGLVFSLFGYLGICINVESKMLHIMVNEGSIGWYLLEIIPSIFLLIGLYKIFQFVLNILLQGYDKVD